MELINQGAEAKIFSSDFREYFGLDKEGEIIVKERVSKSYRIKEIDERLVLQRTLHEARLLHESKLAGVPTPVIFFIDKVKHALVMEKVLGARIKEELLRGTRLRDDLIATIGTQVGRLHSNNIIHGDLTTSNMILRDDEVVFIDFGLGEFSSETERQAVDAHLFKQALKSTHFVHWEEYWSTFVESYCSAYEGGRDSIERIQEIEMRGRYIKRGE